MPVMRNCKRCGEYGEHGVQRKPHGPWVRSKCNKCRRETRNAERGIWRAMLQRCYSKRCKEYQWYGGRGIKVCDRWRDSFENFFTDMGKRPSASHSIERVNNDGDYGPGNCVWIEKKLQSKNQRHTRRIEFNGETDSLNGWARRVGVSAGAIRNRLKAGWSVEKALTTPPTTRTRVLSEDDKLRIVAMRKAGRLDREIAESLGVSRSTITHTRRRLGCA